MLRYKDFELEVNKLYAKVKDNTISIGDMVKGVELLGKMIRDVRSNQILIMKKVGVELRVGKTSETTKGEKTSE